MDGSKLFNSMVKFLGLFSPPAEEAFLGASFLGASFLATSFLAASFLGASFLGASFLGASFLGASFPFLVVLVFLVEGAGLVLAVEVGMETAACFEVTAEDVLICTIRGVA